MTSLHPATFSKPRVATAALDTRTRIYLVDDHPLFRRGLTDLIGSEPDMSVCGEADTAEQAFIEIANLKPDVAIIELSRKDSSGLDLLKRLKELGPGLKTMVLSMHPESSYGLPTLNAGARGYVTKSDPPQRILDAIRRVRTGGVFASRTLIERVLKRVSMGVRDVAPVSTLSERECEVAKLIGQGNTTREIAVRLNVSIKTVETHRGHLKKKLQLENAAQLIQFCVRYRHDNPEEEPSLDTRPDEAGLLCVTTRVPQMAF